MTDGSKNFLTANNSLLQRLQDDDTVYGYDYNRVVDALTGNYIGYTYIAHNDTWVNSENVDPAFPARLNYVIPKNAVQVLEALISFKLLSYRTYNSFSAATTGAGTPHAHALPIAGNAISTNKFLGFDAGDLFAESDVTGSTVSVAHNSTPTTNEATHTHPIVGSSFLGITEGTMAAGVTIQFDGHDSTVSLGGPWSTDVVEMDITQFLPQTQGVWHTVNLTSTQLGQIQTHLRLTVLVSTPK